VVVVAVGGGEGACYPVHQSFEAGPDACSDRGIVQNKQLDLALALEYHAVV